MTFNRHIWLYNRVCIFHFSCRLAFYQLFVLQTGHQK